ncbi:divalent metal ion exporter adaptor subunit IhpB [Rhodopseudomonas palustris]|uniref:HlyD family efflux transporter periplasmic adaptor subunit n=1 Tax=Rhodopseudomonas palustris TaxID=1076 RepID=A0A418VLH5_RHOPL|nr:efflux RND transporter periplasmic adaptor subunit [Rhodopseudomonas palustris]RJF77008.1 HlyD family efflux transporter periplasmic adaptor subunit [Rhodopseudomonas palustris]
MNRTATVIAIILAAAAGALGARYLAPDEHRAPTEHAHDKVAEGEKKSGQHAEPDEHGAQRILISEIKLAAAGASFAEAGSATLSDSLALNGILRANQETLVQVTPRFPGLVRTIRKRIGDQVTRDEPMASIESNQSLTSYELKSPLAGTVIDRQISLGEYASEQKPAFVVADLTTIWVDLSIYRQDIQRVKIGDEVLIDPDDGRSEIKGRIDYLAPIGALDTQTALARVVLPNTDGRLRPGLFVTARLVLAKRDVPVAVRADAIQTLENKTVVFVREADDALEARPVVLGEQDARFVEIKAGLAAGERYVAENSFVVKAEMGKGEAEHGH